MKNKNYFISLVLVLLILPASFSGRTPPKQDLSISESNLLKRQSAFLEQPKPVLTALKNAYPETIIRFSFNTKEKDWVIFTADNQKFYWAEGRLLPYEKRKNWQQYKEYVFYYYPEEFINPNQYPQEYIQKLNTPDFRKDRLTTIDHEYTFYRSLYGGNTRVEIEKHIDETTFLGRKLYVHTIIIPALNRVEKRIRQLAVEDKETAIFLKNLRSVFGYNWRLIGDTKRKSNHCWGTAIDILPQNWKKKKVYWMWERTFNKNWFMVSKAERWCPPDVVVTAFENEGFIWGGKWDLWDNMHFEYRPELLKLQNEFKQFSHINKQ